MTTIAWGDHRMIVGSVFLPEGRARSQQVQADLLTAVSLDHELGHDVAECDICLAIQWGLHASAARIITDLRVGFCSTLVKVIGKEAEPSPSETEKFREIRGAERLQDPPTDKG